MNPAEPAFIGGCNEREVLRGEQGAPPSFPCRAADIKRKARSDGDRERKKNKIELSSSSSPASSEVSDPGMEAAERRNSMNPLPEDDTHITRSVPSSTNRLPTEVSDPGKEAAERKNSMNPLPEDDTHITTSVPRSSNFLPTLSVQDIDRAWRALNPSMVWLLSETLHGTVDVDCGIHASHPLWTGREKIMIRNMPCRSKEDEFEGFISETAAAAGVSRENWTLEMPHGSSGRNRGYAFVTATNPETAVELVRALWQKLVPKRGSQRPLKLQPAFEQAEIVQFSLVLGNAVSL